LLIINPYIFKQFPEITFGFSTKIGLEKKAPYYLNTSYNIGDDFNVVADNRERFFDQLGLNINTVAYQKQVHGDKIRVVKKGGDCGELDAMITTERNLGLALSSADCCTIYIYDPAKFVIAAVHSGWRGTRQKILLKVLQHLSENFSCDPANLICYLGPSIHQQNYEVGHEVAEQFDGVYIKESEGKYYLNISGINYDILVNFGVSENNIQVSKLCSYEYSSILHSYRRDGKHSGRALGIIAMKGNE
jgi:YfiH family protein